MTRALGPGHSEIATPASATEHLFSYGTLQLEAVQLSTFGRRLAGHADQLPGYRLAMIEIRDAAIVATSGQTHHPVLVCANGGTGGPVQGTVFAITPALLAQSEKHQGHSAGPGDL